MSADAQTIPDDIREAAIRAVQAAREDFLLAKVSDNQANLRKVAIDCVEKAILAERKRCASVARDATMMTGAPIQEMGDEVAAAVLSQPKAVKFWMVYGVAQRGSTYQHRSKASAQEEAKRLATQHPGIAFVVLAAVDAYFADVPVMQRIKITKPDPSAYERDSDDSIPF